MRKYLLVLLAPAVVLSLGAAAQRKDKIPFDQVKLFFEFNSTDNDLGVQLLLDGEAWKRLKIFNPSGRQILDLSAKKSLGQLGLTELFWESDEPSPDEVLALFEEGTYEFEGKTVEGDVLEGESTLSHDLPPAPNIVEPSFDGEVVDRTNTVIEWEAIPGIASFEIIVENEAVGAEMDVPLSAAATTLHVPVEFLDANKQYKVEVIAISVNGNKTITERNFVTGP